MKSVPIVPKECLRQAESISPSELPLFYMNDYSKMGLQVSPYEDALEVLKRSSYELSADAASAELVVEEVEDIAKVVRMLTDQGVECQMSDVAIALYQG